MEAMTHSSFRASGLNLVIAAIVYWNRHTSSMPLRIYKIVDSPCPKRCSRIPRHLPGSTLASPAISCGISRRYRRSAPATQFPPPNSRRMIHIPKAFTRRVVYPTTDAMPSFLVELCRAAWTAHPDSPGCLIRPLEIQTSPATFSFIVAIIVVR
jgi:hypothetical protein